MGWWFVLAIQAAFVVFYEVLSPCPTFDEETPVPETPLEYVPIPDRFDWGNLVGTIIVIGVPGYVLFLVFRSWGLV